MAKDFNLPDLVLLNDFGGNWGSFYEFVYQCFKKDFITNPVKSFHDKRLGLKRLPISDDDKEATFYHMSHEGSDEQNREPDLRRMERIRWPKHFILNYDHPELKVWKNRRGASTNILLFHEKENYLLVLSERTDYILPWTAYLVTYKKQKEKLIKEYEVYIKAEAAKLT